MKAILLLLATSTLASAGCGADAMEKRWFDRVDGTITKGQFIDLNTNATERLYIRYMQISDSGVELERTTNNIVLWRVHVQPLGVEHSLYNHDVSVRLEGEKIFVTSTGARRIFEVRSLTTGKLISRRILDRQRWFPDWDTEQAGGVAPAPRGVPLTLPDQFQRSQ